VDSYLSASILQACALDPTLDFPYLHPLFTGQVKTSPGIFLLYHLLFLYPNSIKT